MFGFFITSLSHNQTKSIMQLNQLIRTELEKNPNVDRKELAKKYDVSTHKVGAILNHITRKKNTAFDKYNNAIKKATNTYSNKNGDLKQEARTLMLNSIILKGLMLSLPCKDCTLEQQILKTFPTSKFVGCEYELETYFEMLNTISKKRLPFVELYHGKISDKINEAKTNQYSNLFFDYCGQLGTFYKDIEKAIANDIMQVNGAMCITFNKRISIGTEYIYEKMELLNPRTTNDTNTRCEHTLRTFINRIGGLKYAIEEVFNYKDEGKANMVLMIVRRIA